MESRIDRRVARGRRGYGRAVLATVGLLVLVAGVLGVIGAIQGPRLADSSVDPAMAVERSGQRLVLQANQPVAEITADDVRVDPPSPITIVTQGSAIGVQFDDPLDYATVYSVEVDVTGTATGAAGMLSASFTTPDAELCALERTAATELDQVVCAGLGGGDERVAVAAGRIQEFATSNGTVAAVTLDAAGQPALVASGSALAGAGEDAGGESGGEPGGESGGQSAGEPDATASDDAAADHAAADDAAAADAAGNGSAGSESGASGSSTRTIPDAESLRGVRFADGGTVLGYLAVPRGDAGGSAIGQLYIDDLSNPAGGPIEVRGPAGEALSVVTWAFVPGTTSIVVQADDLQMFVIDPFGDTEPVPLGQHAELRGFLPGGVDLIVADAERGSVIDLRSGETTMLALPDPEIPASAYQGKLQVIDAETYLAQYYVTDVGAGEMPTVLLEVGPNGTRELFAPRDGRIQDLCASPNGRYVAVEFVPDNSEPDLYPIVPGSAGRTLQVIDIESGELVAERSGMLANWCG